VNVKPKKHTHERWTTVAVNVLPAGYVNRFTDKLDDLTETTFETVCPAILLQEHRSTHVVCERESGPPMEHTEIHEPPYETRAVYASDGVEGWIEPAEESSNYVGTFFITDPDASKGQ
jgi:hypothetical protein